MLPGRREKTSTPIFCKRTVRDDHGRTWSDRAHAPDDVRGRALNLARSISSLVTLRPAWRAVEPPTGQTATRSLTTRTAPMTGMSSRRSSSVLRFAARMEVYPARTTTSTPSA